MSNVEIAAKYRRGDQEFQVEHWEDEYQVMQYDHGSFSGSWDVRNSLEECEADIRRLRPGAEKVTPDREKAKPKKDFRDRDMER